MIWYDTIYDVIWYDIWYIWYMLWYDIRDYLIYDMVWYDIWCDMIRYMIYMIYAVIWYKRLSDIWYGMIQYMMWYDTIYAVCCKPPVFRYTNSMAFPSPFHTKTQQLRTAIFIANRPPLPPGNIPDTHFC